MKRIFFLVIGAMTVMSLSAQMTVWSNGQSVYNSSVESVDSISFGNAVNAGVVERAASQQTTASLVGHVYLYGVPNNTSAQSQAGLAFYSESEGYYFLDGIGSAGNSNSGWDAIPFTYTRNNVDITVTTDGGDFHAKLIGTNAIVFYDLQSGSRSGQIKAGCFFLWK